MEAAAAACRGAVLARDRPVDRARPRPRLHLHGVVAGPAARRRLLVDRASAHSRDAVDVARETVQVDEDVASTDILPPPDVPGKTVQVKFVLQKQCAFGQRFLVVGDDPALGLWDPTNASALDWSEGHVWTVKKDLPADKLIEFKFLLQDPSGQVRWQDGSNRILQIITETSNTLVVSEDWDDAKCRKVSEEAHLSIGEEDVIFSASNGALLADEQPQDENQETNNGVKNVSVYGEKTSAVGVDASSLQYEDQKVPDEVRRKANVLAQNGNPVVGAAQYAGRNGEDAISYEEGAAVENRPASLFENDMVWIRKTLLRLLRSLGFQIGTTKT